MWKPRRNKSSRSSSSASVTAVSLHTAPPTTPSAPARFSKSSQSSQNSNEELLELLAFHKSLVHSLGEDLQERCVAYDKVKDLSLTQEAQISEQQTEIEYLASREINYKRRVAELEIQVSEDKIRLDELLKSVNSWRKANVESQDPELMVPLDGIVKDALIEQLESELKLRTQQGFDHDREMDALVTSHEHKVSELRAETKRLSREVKHEHKVSELQAEMESLRSELKHERSVVAKYTWDLAEITKKMQAAKDKQQQRQQQAVREALSAAKDKQQQQVVHGAPSEQGRSGNAAVCDEKLTQAVSYTKELELSDRLGIDGKEVELHHLRNLCGLAQSQTEYIVHLLATNTDLVAANTKLQAEKKDHANSPLVSHRRNVTWDLPLRNIETHAPIPADPRIPTKLRKRFAMQPPSPHRDNAPRTAPLFSPPSPTTPVPVPAPPNTASKLSFPHKPAGRTQKPDHQSHENASERLHVPGNAYQNVRPEARHTSREIPVSPARPPPSAFIRDGRIDAEGVAESMAVRYRARRGEGPSVPAWAAEMRFTEQKEGEGRVRSPEKGGACEESGGGG